MDVTSPWRISFFFHSTSSAYWDEDMYTVEHTPNVIVGPSATSARQIDASVCWDQDLTLVSCNAMDDVDACIFELVDAHIKQDNVAAHEFKIHAHPSHL